MERGEIFEINLVSAGTRFEDQYMIGERYNRWMKQSEIFGIGLKSEEISFVRLNKYCVVR